MMHQNDGPATLLSEAREVAAHDLRRGAELAETAVQLARHHENPAALAAALTFLGQCLWRLADNPSAREVIREAAALHESLGDDNGLCSALNTDGNVSQLLGDYAGALETHARCLTLRRHQGDRPGEAASLNNLGAVHFELGDFTTSLDYHLQSLRIKAECGDRLGEALSLGNIGTVYFELGDYDSALEYHQQSLALRQDLGDRAGEAYPLSNIGEIHLRLGRHAEALDYLECALAIRRETGDRAGEALDGVNLGRVQHARGDIPAAIDSLTRSLKLAGEIGLIPAQINALLALARLQLSALPPKLRRRAEAWGSRGTISLFSEALQLADSSGARQHACEAHQGLAEVHKLEGRPAESLVHFEKFHALKESISGEAAGRQLVRLQALQSLAVERREQAGERLRGRELSRAQLALRRTRQARRELHQAISAGLREPLGELHRRAVELAAIAALPAPARALAEAIRADAALALDRMQAILRAGVSQSLDIRLHRSPVMLDALVAGVISQHESRPGGSAIRLVTEACPVEVDSLLIVEALDQVLERAVALALQGGALRVTVRRETECAAVSFIAATPQELAPATDITGLEAAREILRRHGGDLAPAPGMVGESTLRIRLPLQDPFAREKEPA
jgi:tetratricopeptide (TPR) repeat protein